MATGQRLTDKSAATKLAADDLLMCVDVSDTTGSADGTSLKIAAKHIITTDVVAISAANFQALGSTPITLVAAPGAGWAILPITAMIYVDYGTSTETNKRNLYYGHGSTAGIYFGYKSGFMHNISTNAVYSFTTGNISIAATPENESLKLHSDTSFTSDPTAAFYITYQIVAV